MPMVDIWDQALGAAAAAGGGGGAPDYLDQLYNAGLGAAEIYGLIDEAERLAYLQVTLSWIQAMQIFVWFIPSSIYSKF